MKAVPRNSIPITTARAARPGVMDAKPDVTQRALSLHGRRDGALGIIV